MDDGLRGANPVLQRWQSAFQQLNVAGGRISGLLSVGSLNRFCAQINSVWRTSPEQRRFAVAIAGSLLLHVVLILFLLPSDTGLMSVGTTGVGSVDGAGTAVTLVEASELIPPEAAEAQSATAEKSILASEPVATESTSDAIAEAEAVDEPKPVEEATKRTATKAIWSDSQASSDNAADASAGAHGQNGQANADLWNAIAPCWNRIADKDTRSATLTISFASDGGLAAPPLIERDPEAAITNQSLQSEAQALQALAACGAYPMAADQQSVTVVFPAPAR